MTDDPVKDALRMMPYGFYAVTSRDGDDVNAMSLNWASQVSFEPRLIALGVQKTSYSHGLIERGGAFVLNIFRAEDADAIKPFTKGRKKSPDKMKDAKYTEGPETGVPILEGVAAYLECKVVNIIDIGGDHDVVVGEVVGAGLRKPGEASKTLTLPDLG